MRDHTIKAVYDSDLNDLLQSLGVSEDVRNGKYKCIFCGDNINFDNIDGIIPEDNAVAFCCNKPICRYKLLMGEKRNESK